MLDPDSEYYFALRAQTEALAQELGVSLTCAQDIEYLRTRSRWTPELEQELIDLHAKGEAPNMCEFGVTEQTQNALLESASLSTYAKLYGGPGVCDI
jgi:hypothetical protein